jgi:hypothetical protein
MLNMKTGITPLILVALAILLVSVSDPSAFSYYVSNSGDDKNDGKSPQTALATLAAAKLKIKSRDTLLLKRGDLFRDSLNLSTIADPVVVAYGATDMPKPVISGSVAISPWQVYAGAVWVASGEKKVENLFADNTLMILARYPDTGWLRVDTMTENDDGSNTVIDDAALTMHPRNAPGYWNNAQIRIRRWSWWFETRRIALYNASGRISLDGKSIIHIMENKGWGFFIDNKREELDAPGEWFYDSAAQKIYFCNPYTDSVVSGYGTGADQWKLFDYTLQRWNALFTWADKTGKTDPFKRPAGLNAGNPFGKAMIFINETGAEKVFTLGSTTYKDLEGNVQSGTITVSPFYSKILIQADSIVSIITHEINGDEARIIKDRAGLRYLLFKNGIISVSIYTMNGRQVYCFRNVPQKAGTYSIHFNQPDTRAPALASGVYQYTFRILQGRSRFFRSGKFIIVR